MTCQRLEPHDLLRRVDPASLGFASTRELLDRPLSWIGQQRAEAAARFGLGMALPGYNLLVVGEVGTGRTSLMRQLMQDHAATCPVPPDLLFLHHVAQPERPWALRLPDRPALDPATARARDHFTPQSRQTSRPHPVCGNPPALC